MREANHAEKQSPQNRTQAHFVHWVILRVIGRQ
jgi:hypothetical protein